MRAIVQRVSEASVSIDGQIKSKIGSGLLVLLGIESADNLSDIEWLSKKIVNMRIFDDQDGVMSRSVLDVYGELLIISQFTLFASTKKGNRPSYIRAAKHDISIPLYEKFISEITKFQLPVFTGVFGADMKVALINDGPVTILLDTQNRE